MYSQGFSPIPLSDFFPAGDLNLAPEAHWPTRMRAETYRRLHARTADTGASRRPDGSCSHNVVLVRDMFPGFTRAQTHSRHSHPGRSRSPASLSLDFPCRRPGFSQLEPGLGARQEPALQQQEEQKQRLILISLSPFSATGFLVPGGGVRPEVSNSPPNGDLMPW